MKTDIERLIRAAYYWGRDNGERRSEKNLADFFNTSIAKDVLTKAENKSISGVSESLPCVMSPECEIIKICADEDVANKEMEDFKKQHGGEWYVDDVRIQK